jgi:hypothetical protein
MYLPATKRLDENQLRLLHNQPNFNSGWPAANDDLVFINNRSWDPETALTMWSRRSISSSL